LKILIVDNELHIRELYKVELEEEGYEVISTDSGRKALRLFEKEYPDIVVTGMFMYDIGSRRLLRKMKEQKPKIPVIISTAYDYQKDFDVLVSESNAFIVKSSDLSELKKTIKKFIKKKRQRGIYKR
jgi:DNA-binding NtrC family response regulator